MSSAGEQGGWISSACVRCAARDGLLFGVAVVVVVQEIPTGGAGVGV